VGITPGTLSGIVLRLLAPFLISIAPWPFTIILTHNASSSDLEGAYYLTAFAGILSFVLTGSLAGIALGESVREKSLPFAVFAAIIFLVGLPTLSFQILAFSSSILPGFMLGGPWTTHNMTPYYAEATMIALTVYLFYSLILYSQAKNVAMQVILAAVALSVGSFGIVVFRVLHS
jgi:hypothetical protein